MKMNLSRAKKKILIFILAIPFLVLPFELAWGEVDHLIITEVQIEGENSHNDFIEIYNPTNSEIDISSFQIRKKTQGAKDDKGDPILEFPKGTKIKAKSYILWANSENGYANLINADISNTEIISSNNSIALFDNSGKTLAERKIIDAVGWGEGNQYSFVENSFCKNPSKNQSLQRKQINGIYQDTDNNADDFEINNNPSPTGGGLVIPFPQSLSANAGDDIISTTGTEITFDASASTGDIQSYSWNFGDGETATGKIVNHKYQYPGEYYVSLIVSDSNKNKSSDLKKVTIFSSEIFISEFLPNPKGDDSGKEWIEIVNESSNVQNISGWGLGNSSEKPKFIFPSGSYLASQGLILLSSSLTKISLSNDSGSLFLFYPSGSISQEVKYENPGEDVSIARKDGEYFYTKNLTPGMKNIVSLSFKEVQSNSASQTKSSSQSSTSTSTSTSIQSQNQSQVQNPSEASTQNLTPNQESAFFNSKVSEENEDLALQGQTVAVPTKTLPQDVLNKNLLAEVKANQTKLILSIVCVTLCSGFFGVSLVILRRKLKNKNIGDKNIEKIEVEIEK